MSDVKDRTTDLPHMQVLIKGNCSQGQLNAMVLAVREAFNKPDLGENVPATGNMQAEVVRFVQGIAVARCTIIADHTTNGDDSDALPSDGFYGFSTATPAFATGDYAADSSYGPDYTVRVEPEEFLTDYYTSQTIEGVYPERTIRIIDEPMPNFDCGVYVETREYGAVVHDIYAIDQVHVNGLVADLSYSPDFKFNVVEGLENPAAREVEDALARFGYRHTRVKLDATHFTTVKEAVVAVETIRTTRQIQGLVTELDIFQRIELTEKFFSSLDALGTTDLSTPAQIAQVLEQMNNANVPKLREQLDLPQTMWLIDIAADRAAIAAAYARNN